jgi:hypothetical protein
VFMHYQVDAFYNPHFALFLSNWTKISSAEIPLFRTLLLVSLIRNEWCTCWLIKEIVFFLSRGTTLQLHVSWEGWNL